ncbi:hypothetical protein N8632_01105 [bacterium]|nr:hypothetical protein [bacterium]
MLPTIFTLTYADFKLALSAILLIMVLGGWFRNLYAKKRIQAALKAVSSGPPDPDSNPQTGEVIAIEHFPSVLGLPGYLPPTQWQRFFGTGTEMELLFTQSALIFCDPSASESLKRTSIPFVDVISTRTDYNNGSNLIIKSKCGTIYCDTDRTLGAKPVKELLDTILRDQPIKASQKGPGQQEGFHGCVSLSNITDLVEPHQPTAPPALPTESQNFQTPAPQSTSVSAGQGIKGDRNVNNPRKITKDTLHDDKLLGINSDMPTEEISTHLNKLFRKYSGRISHDDPRIAAKARERLKKIGEARARHIGVY